MDFNITGKIALITGAARGIGYSESSALAAEGASVIINDLDLNVAEDAAARLRAGGASAHAIAADVADAAAVGAMFGEIDRRFGKLDILVNNAGAGGKHLGAKVEDMALEDWDIIVNTHLRGTFLCSQAAIPLMKRGKYGRIINTSSMNFTGGGRPGVTNYTAAKAGIAGFSRNLAKEVGWQGITVNAIAPGYVETELIAGFSPAYRRLITEQSPLGRFCQPDEVGALVAFLCSQQAAFINGELICIDGGKRDFDWSGDE